MIKKILRAAFWTLSLLFLIGIGLFLYADKMLDTPPPHHNNSLKMTGEVVVHPQTRQIGSNWLREDETGILEMYIEGEAYDRGVVAGRLLDGLMTFQEAAFTHQLENFIPSYFKQRLLIAAAKFYTRHIADFVRPEYQREIYGISLSASTDYLLLGSNYHRKLSYHAAHDIGHAFQNMGFVSGCSALAVRDSAESRLLLGRNFDFYMGDEFAKNKLVSCIRPDSGYAFVSISWPGLMGVVSGMNEAGLAVVLNAGPSQIPEGVRTPVSLIAREIVQYAGNLSEAIEIAKSRDVFVAENLILASANDDRAMIIEKSPGKTVLYNPGQTDAPLICTNHFQSDENIGASFNQEAIELSTTAVRYQRISELLDSTTVQGPEDILSILRDRYGPGKTEIGINNELAVNQFTAHHTVIFDPAKRLMMIAAVPDQLGPMLTYQLDSIFSTLYREPQRLWQDSLPASAFSKTQAYRNFLVFKTEQEALLQAIDEGSVWPEERLNSFETLNPDHYRTYFLLAKYHLRHQNKTRAKAYFKQMLALPIAWKREKIEATELLARCD